MSKVEDLKKEELVKLQAEEVNLEDLIVLGKDKKIPIHIEYPEGDNIVKARVLVRQLTLKELENIDINNTSDLSDVLTILSESMFKVNGQNFTNEELTYLPVGVLKEILLKIFELSGINEEDTKLKDF